MKVHLQERQSSVTVQQQKVMLQGRDSGGAHDGDRVLGTEQELARSRGGWRGRGQARS